MPDEVDNCSSESFRDMLNTVIFSASNGHVRHCSEADAYTLHRLRVLASPPQANGAAERLKQSLAGMRPSTGVYVGVHLRFTATDDRVLDMSILPSDFGHCMEVWDRFQN